MITKEQAKRLAEVATAIADGKRVTYTDRMGSIWEINGVSVLCADSIYTIHEPPPEPKLRPWTLEEAIDNIGRVVRKTSDKSGRMIVGVPDCSDGVTVYLGGIGYPIDAQTLLDVYRFLDGSPCGVRE